MCMLYQHATKIEDTDSSRSYFIIYNGYTAKCKGGLTSIIKVFAARLHTRALGASESLLDC